MLLAVMAIASAIGLAAAGRDGSRRIPAGRQDAELVLDPNRATPEALSALPNLGPTLARRIAEARADGPFRSLEDVQARVRGIGPATLAQIRPYLRIEARPIGRPDLDAGSIAIADAGTGAAAPLRRSSRKPPASKARKSRSTLVQLTPKADAGWRPDLRPVDPSVLIRPQAADTLTASQDMAKKRPRPRKESSRSRPRTEPHEPFPRGIPDRRAIEGVMWAGVIEARGGPPSDVPLARAQAMAYEAFGRPDLDDRARMAHQALEICPDCADAHVILGEYSVDARKALQHYERGVAAGERALGPEAFREAVGHFWGILETRPYMRAREGLAHALWLAGRSNQAIGHLLEMLRLNPGDNQGIRFILVPWLLTLGRDDEVEAILDDRYPDAAWNAWFTRALIGYRRNGDTPEGQQSLRRGDEQNRFIAPLLLGAEPYPPERPDDCTPGSLEEAHLYARGSRCAWRSTPGAVVWLRRTFAPPPVATDTATRTFRPPAAELSRIAGLPGSSETWQAKFLQVPTKMLTKGGTVIPWAFMMGSPSTGRVLGQSLFETEPGAPQLWGTILQAFDPSRHEDPHRPSTIEVLPDPRWDALRPHLGALGIALSERETLPALNNLLNVLIQMIVEHDPPGLMEMPRVTSQSVGSLFRATADYFRKAPWRTVGDRYGIRVECPRFESGPWTAVVMGQAGWVLGLSLYERLDLVRAIWKSRTDEDREALRSITSLAVTFEEVSTVHPKDVFSARKYKWDVVDSEAFPSIFRKEAGLSVRPPLAWEMILLEGCLRAVPAFLAKYRPCDGARSEMTVPVATGELDLVLTWVE